MQHLRRGPVRCAHPPPRRPVAAPTPTGPGIALAHRYAEAALALQRRSSAPGCSAIHSLASPKSVGTRAATGATLASGVMSSWSNRATNRHAKTRPPRSSRPVPHGYRVVRVFPRHRPRAPQNTAQVIHVVYGADVWEPSGDHIASRAARCTTAPHRASVVHHSSRLGRGRQHCCRRAGSQFATAAAGRARSRPTRQALRPGTPQDPRRPRGTRR